MRAMPREIQAGGCKVRQGMVCRFVLDDGGYDYVCQPRCVGFWTGRVSLFRRKIEIACLACQKNAWVPLKAIKIAVRVM